MLAGPVLIRVMPNPGLAYWLNRELGDTRNIASFRADRRIQLRANDGGSDQPNQ